MTFEEFKSSLAQSSVADLPPALRALREDARGNWDAAHTIAQDIDDNMGATGTPVPICCLSGSGNDGNNVTPKCR